MRRQRTVLLIALVIACFHYSGSEALESERGGFLRPSVLSCGIYGVDMSRKAQGLKGPVQSVSLAYSSSRIHDNAVIEAPTELHTLTFYDRFGTQVALLGICSRLKTFSGEVSDYCKTSVVRDRRGRIIIAMALENNSDKGFGPDLQTTKWTFRYDAEDNLTEWVIVYQSGPSAQAAVQYDTEGRVTQVTEKTSVTYYSYGPNKKLAFSQAVGLLSNETRIVRVFDGEGNTVEQIIDIPGPTWADTERCSRTYDLNGNLLTQEIRSSTRGYDSRITKESIAYRYDEMRKVIIAEVTIDRDDNTRPRTHTYDLNGTLLEQQGYMVTGTILKPETVRTEEAFAYQFDNNGNWIKQTRSVFATPGRIIYRDFGYFPGQLPAR